MKLTAGDFINITDSVADEIDKCSLHSLRVLFRHFTNEDLASILRSEAMNFVSVNRVAIAEAAARLIASMGK